MKKIYIWGLLCTLSFGCLYAQHTKTYTLSFDKKDFTLQSTENGTVIHSSKHNLILGEETSLPALPLVSVNILLPESSTYRNFSYSKIEEPVANNIVIVPNPQVRVGSSSFTPAEPSAYPIRMYPSDVTFASENIMDGYRYVAFIVSPFSYDAATGTLNIASTIELTVSSVTTRSVSIHRGTMDGVIEQLVYNPEEVSTSYAQTRRATASTLNAAEVVEYLIITSASLKDAFQPLANWKTAKGVRARVITTEEIYANYNEPTNQLKIKRCLQDYYLNYGLQYALLGGDDNIVPVQGCYGEVHSTIDRKIPTDLFYACFDNSFDWNANGNDLIGEVSDNIDLLPEIYISRIPVRTLEHVETFVDRTVAYELNPLFPKEYNKMLLTGCEYCHTINGQSDAEVQSEKMYSTIKSRWSSVDKYRFYDTATDFVGGASYQLNAVNLQEQLNKGYYHMHMATHGSYNSWALENGEYNIGHAASLQNNIPMIIATTACLTNSFDADTSPGYSVEPCLSEAFLRNPNSGVVAYWGSSRYSWYLNGEEYFNKFGASFNYNNIFYENLFNASSTIPVDVRNKFGFATTAAKSEYALFTGTTYRWLQFSLNAMGDPELPVYTKEPEPIPDVVYSWDGSTLVVQPNMLGCKVVVTSSDDGGQSYYAVEEMFKIKCSFQIPISSGFQFCVMKKNYIPNIFWDANKIIHVQNKSYLGSAIKVKGHHIAVGSNVTEAKTSGPVAVNRGCTTFEADSCVVINGEFTCKLGAEFKIRINKE